MLTTVRLPLSELAGLTRSILVNYFTCSDSGGLETCVRDILDLCSRECFKFPKFTPAETNRAERNECLSGMILECQFLIPKPLPNPTRYLPTISSEYLEAAAQYRLDIAKFCDVFWYEVIEPTIETALRCMLESIAEQNRIELSNWRNMTYILRSNAIIVEIGSDWRIDYFNKLYAEGKIEI